MILRSLSPHRNSSYLLIVILLLSGCGNITTSETANTLSNTTNQLEGKASTWVLYQPKKCVAHPWETNVTATEQPQTITNNDSIINYYKERHDITILKVVVGQDPTVDTSCQTCKCPTGTVVQAEVNTDYDREALLNLGFTEQRDTPLFDSASTTSVATNQSSTNVNTPASMDEILQQRGDTNTATTSGEKPVVDITDPDENNVTNHKGQDGIIEQTAKYLQQMIWVDYTMKGSYPTTLQELDLTGVDLTGITYTPKGSTPYKDYELRAEYSDSVEVYHAMQQ